MSAGYAEIKTHVLRREEKGLLGIPFKRFMTAAVVAAGGFFIAKLLVGPLAVMIAIFIYFIAMIGQMERGGLPFYTRLYLGWRGRIILSATHQPDGVLSRAAQAANLPVHLALLDADTLFAPPKVLETFDLADVVMFTSPREAGQGLVHINDPLADLIRQREANL